MALLADFARESLSKATQCLDAGDGMEAGKLITEVLRRDPDNPEAWFIYGRAMLESDKPMYARLAYEKLTSGPAKHRAQAWINLGKSYDDLGWHDRARGAFRKAIRIDPDMATATRNMATSYVQTQSWEQAEQWAKKAIAQGDNEQSHIDLAYIYLNTGRLGEGWDEYATGIGKMQWRKRKNYGGEPEWTGGEGSIIVYGEQGIGDQIAYMSCVPDIKASVAAIDCYPKLEGLFGRTFGVPAYGTMFDDPVPWQATFNASAAMSLLPRYTRRKPEDFPGTAYLKTCPIRTEQWRQYLDTLPGKKIGLAWTGGIAKTGQDERSTTFETFAPLVKENHTFLSLEYKSPGEISIPHYPWATETNDYDDTAALVANLDLIICVPTSVAHLAGALGIPCWVVQHGKPHFLFQMPLWQSVKSYYRKGDSWSVMREVEADLTAWLNT